MRRTSAIRPLDSAGPKRPGQHAPHQHREGQDQERPEDVRVLEAAGGAAEFHEKVARQSRNSRRSPSSVVTSAAAIQAPTMMSSRLAVLGDQAGEEARAQRQERW